MTVGYYKNPNFTLNTASEYKGRIDACFGVASRLAAAFAPSENPSTPGMSVYVLNGQMLVGSTLVERGSQTALFTAPVSNPRIDRIVIDQVTGLISTVTGTEAASPVAPAIPAGKLPCASIALTTSTTAITNSMITDERVPAVPQAAGGSLAFNFVNYS